MTRFYVQRESGVRETMGALAVALGVGGLSFYLVRLLLARENLESKAPPTVTREPRRRNALRGEEAG